MVTTSDLINALASLSQEELNAVRYLLDMPFNSGTGEPDKKPEAVIEKAKQL